jgi:hypothetical protein
VSGTMAIFGINETSRFTIDFLTERASDGTRLAAVVVVHDAHDRQPRTWREGLRVLLRRLFDRARLRVEMRARAHAYSQAHRRPDVRYDSDGRESRAWAVALLADAEAASLVGRKLLDRMADGR